jgi:hypothetical protein
VLWPGWPGEHASGSACTAVCGCSLRPHACHDQRTIPTHQNTMRIRCELVDAAGGIPPSVPWLQDALLWPALHMTHIACSPAQPGPAALRLELHRRSYLPAGETRSTARQGILWFTEFTERCEAATQRSTSPPPPPCCTMCLLMAWQMSGCQNRTSAGRLQSQAFQLLCTLSGCRRPHC